MNRDRLKKLFVILANVNGINAHRFIYQCFPTNYNLAQLKKALIFRDIYRRVN